MDVESIEKIVLKTNLKHIAVIMDGNRRWAKEKNLPSYFGHKKGVEALKTITKSCKKCGIKFLTVYAFSTENWNRTQEEVSFLMELLAKTIKSEVPIFVENNIKLSFIGERENLSSEILKVIKYGENQTKQCTSLNLQIAFNYGSKQEIVQAIKKICKDVNNEKLDINKITENIVEKYLYTKNIPNPDLLIRTGGEKRISNYLLWQCAYSEVFVTDTFWPDFDENALFIAIEEFNKRNRRFGK